MSNDSTGLRHRFIVSASWMVALRWSMKGIGLVNTSILARLLAPSDFGLIAMSSLAVGFIDIWLSFGVDVALIQKKSVGREEYDTAWSLKLVQGMLVSLILVAVSPWAEEYFHESRIVGLLHIMALCSLLSAACNIGIIDFRKHLDFQREFIYSIIGRLVSFIFTIALAFWLRNYWAMVIGIIINQVVSWVLSYSMHPYRPRLAFSRFGAFWSFSKWMLAVNIGIYISSKLDEFIAVRIVSSSSYGIYNVASDLGQIPANELSLPVSRVLVPLLSKLQDDPSHLWNTYVNTMAGVNTVTLPAGIGMALVAPQLVPILLGEAWLDAVPYVQILALYSAIRFIFSGAYNALTAQGKVRAFAAMLWLEIVLLFVLGLIGGVYFGLLGIAWARLVVAVLIGAVVIGMVYRHGRISPLRFLSRLARAGASCLVMAEVLGAWPHAVVGNPLLDLLASVIVGAAAYACSLLLIWVGLGKPDGAERIVVSFLGKKLGLAAT